MYDKERNGAGGLGKLRRSGCPCISRKGRRNKGNVTCVYKCYAHIPGTPNHASIGPFWGRATDTNCGKACATAWAQIGAQVAGMQAIHCPIYGKCP